MHEKITRFIELAEKLKNDEGFLGSVAAATEAITRSIKNGGQLLVCGNGGSATQASHMVGELVGRFDFDRPALPAISLFDLATTTAIGNDYGYDDVFSRFVDGLGREGDILFSLSTSGNSKNCIKAIESAKRKQLTVISLLGRDGGQMKLLSDISVLVPYNETPAIQEVHLMVLHQICQDVELHFFKK